MEELFKRIIKPFFIPLIVLVASLIIFSNKDSFKYNKLQYSLFFIGFFLIIISEISARYIGNTKIELFFLFPIIIFYNCYLLLILRIKKYKMIKIYQKYLALSFLKFFIIVSLIFFSLVFILNVFEEVSFLKDTDTNIYLPFFLTLLNSPSVLFETFPFIFFISTQFLFIRLLDKEELEIFKKISLTNF